MSVRSWLAYPLYVLTLVAALLAVSVLAEALNAPRNSASSFAAFVLAAAIPALVFRRVGAVSPIGVACVVLFVGLACLAYVTHNVRAISLPTGYPYSWQNAAALVFNSWQIFWLVLASFVSGSLLAIVRRLLHLHAPSPSQPGPRRST
jgi:hypothetical protein